MAVAGSYGMSNYGSGNYGKPEGSALEVAIKRAIKLDKRKFMYIRK